MVPLTRSCFKQRRRLPAGNIFATGSESVSALLRTTSGAKETANISIFIDGSGSDCASGRSICRSRDGDTRGGDDGDRGVRLYALLIVVSDHILAPKEKKRMKLDRELKIVL